MSQSNITRICLTPTRNEGWIIERFLAAARIWADHVIIADQDSTDDTTLRAAAVPGVQVIRNESQVYDEAHRQRLLLTHARRIPGPRVLIALDADEALSANSQSSADWQKINEAPPGTILRFRWVNVLPGFQKVWIPAERIPCGFVDDGSEHIGTKIHSCRVPRKENAPVLDLDDIVVLHFQYTVWDRVVSKHRWYQAWEHANHPAKGPLQIYRAYNHMYGSWDRDEIHDLNTAWLKGFREMGADYFALQGEPVTWWDREILQMLLTHGTQHFRRIDIWDKNWNEVASALGKPSPSLADPRTRIERQIHRLLKLTQSKRKNWATRALEHALRRIGW